MEVVIMSGSAEHSVVPVVVSVNVTVPAGVPPFENTKAVNEIGSPVTTVVVGVRVRRMLEVAGFTVTVVEAVTVGKPERVARMVSVLTAVPTPQNVAELVAAAIVSVSGETQSLARKVNAEAPLKVIVRATLCTGEIVTVKVVLAPTVVVTVGGGEIDKVGGLRVNGCAAVIEPPGFVTVTL